MYSQLIYAELAIYHGGEQQENSSESQVLHLPRGIRGCEESQEAA